MAGLPWLVTRLVWLVLAIWFFVGEQSWLTALPHPTPPELRERWSSFGFTPDHEAQAKTIAGRYPPEWEAFVL